MFLKLQKKIKRRYLDSFNHKINYLKRKKIISDLGKKYNINGKLISNLLLITIECLRKDHISLYNYKKTTTPFLETIRNKLAIFTNAKSTSSYTWPSIASLLSGLYPSEHGAIKTEKLRRVTEKDLPNPLKNEILTISEIFEFLGGKTYFNAGGILFAELVVSGRYMNIDTGLSDHADIQIDKIKDIFNENKNTPIYAHIHIPDTHSPLYAPEYYRNIFNAPFNEEVRGWKHSDITDEAFNIYKENKLKLYDSSISFIDYQISKLYNFLEDEELLDNTLIFITTDHGEEFWDHIELEKKYFYDPRNVYGVGHGHNMFNEITDIPLIVLGYGVKSGIYNNLISAKNIFATILDIFNIDNETKYFNNINIFNKTDSTPLCEDIAYGYDKFVYWKNNSKYLFSKEDNIKWVFDKIKDPKELKPNKIS